VGTVTELLFEKKEQISGLQRLLISLYIQFGGPEVSIGGTFDMVFSLHLL